MVRHVDLRQSHQEPGIPTTPPRMTTTLVLRALVLACFSLGVLTAGYLWGELDVSQAPLIDKAEPSIVAGPVFVESDDLREEFEVLRSRGVAFVNGTATELAGHRRSAWCLTTRCGTHVTSWTLAGCWRRRRGGPVPIAADHRERIDACSGEEPPTAAQRALPEAASPGRSRAPADAGASGRLTSLLRASGPPAAAAGRTTIHRPQS